MLRKKTSKKVTNATTTEPKIPPIRRAASKKVAKEYQEPEMDQLRRRANAGDVGAQAELRRRGK